MPEIHSTNLCYLTYGIMNPKKNHTHGPQQPLGRYSMLTMFQAPNSNKYPQTPILFFHHKAHNWVTLGLLRLGAFFTLEQTEKAGSQCS